MVSVIILPDGFSVSVCADWESEKFIGNLVRSENGNLRC